MDSCAARARGEASVSSRLLPATCMVRGRHMSGARLVQKEHDSLLHLHRVSASALQSCRLLHSSMLIAEKHQAETDRVDTLHVLQCK